MYKTQTNKVMNYLMIKARNKYLIGTVTNHQTRRGLKWLRNGLKFLYAADQDYGTKGSEFVPFFGIQAATISLPSDLFKKGTKVYFYNVIRVNSSYEITLEDLGSKTGEENFLNLMNNFYEKEILKHNGDYEYVLGQISMFEYSLRSDGGFDWKKHLKHGFFLFLKSNVKMWPSNLLIAPITKNFFSFRQ